MPAAEGDRCLDTNSVSVKYMSRLLTAQTGIRIQVGQEVEAPTFFNSMQASHRPANPTRRLHRKLG